MMTNTLVFHLKPNIEDIVSDRTAFEDGESTISSQCSPVPDQLQFVPAA